MFRTNLDEVGNCPIIRFNSFKCKILKQLSWYAQIVYEIHTKILGKLMRGRVKQNIFLVRISVTE